MVSTYIAITTSNMPRLNDVPQARQVLERYYLDGEVRAVITEEDPLQRLAIFGYDWPAAWKIPEGIVPDEFEPDWDLDGEDGFNEFLRELALWLAEPLTVQAIGVEDCRFPQSACEWHVRPGSVDIEIGGFQHGEPSENLDHSTPIVVAAH